ncbi:MULTISPECIES: Lrp/AsnC family transcriptional regulator [Burkholderia]|uniref:Lrp/AsnC family transcriptional regulator n=1 Tax=Burkholderia TaxID=32008 RepID=UPI00064EE2A8|nr:MULTISPECIES: Lrp/AsnC family transcriptional regulator [Burkholderia]KML19716.1 AsnC family transcriptional regulator [Burkholderia cepacia]KMN59558.1 AsnC family transcriptional regulator [Burkholderia sp. LK4]
MGNRSIGNLDHIDRQILEALQANGRLTMAELAEKVSLSQSPCWRRVQLLEEAGFIEGYHARLSRKMLGLSVHGFVSVQMREHSLPTAVTFEREVGEMPGAISCQSLSGSYDYQIELVAADHDAFTRLVREIRAFAGVANVYTSFTLQEIKIGGTLPIDGG